MKLRIFAAVFALTLLCPLILSAEERGAGVRAVDAGAAIYLPLGDYGDVTEIAAGLDLRVKGELGGGFPLFLIGQVFGVYNVIVPGGTSLYDLGFVFPASRSRSRVRARKENERRTVGGLRLNAASCRRRVAERKVGTSVLFRPVSLGLGGVLI